MRKNPQIFWSLILIFLLGVFFGFKYFSSDSDVISVFQAKLDSLDNKDEKLPLGEGQLVEKLSSKENIYRHSVLGFSFSYPKEYKISSFGNYYESSGETVLVQKEDGQKGVQVLITPFDENIQLTKERIKKDLPDLVMNSVTDVSIKGDNPINVVKFSSTNSSTIGKSLEAWFVFNKNLYQISGGDGSIDLFDNVIASWKLE